MLSWTRHVRKAGEEARSKNKCLISHTPVAMYISTSYNSYCSHPPPFPLHPPSTLSPLPSTSPPPFPLHPHSLTSAARKTFSTESLQEYATTCVHTSCTPLTLSLPSPPPPPNPTWVFEVSWGRRRPMASRERWVRAVSRAFQSVENTSSMAPGPKICRRNWIGGTKGN